ncbi:arylsulfatase [Massilia forsythiae]|uniref:Arylsulfatase n=1 Tax=Massilia forsythiae TaxID=2728020 RepID=A0A7Z2W0G0_9BURK|nr:arylsulfatase [Massilia forsythiae]QJE02489.1 arylsulfatase [Massilia forsythiae]
MKRLTSGALAAAAFAAAIGVPGAATTPAAPAKRPNILYIMADDLGYSDIGAFGGEIETPNLDALARDGRLLANHHTGTVCAITRAMLISGTDHHLVGEGTMGAPRDERRGLPGYEGYLNDSALSVAQLLRDGGYHTYMAGKWHLGAGEEGKGKTPDQWGFERSYALLPGAARNHFGHEPADARNYSEDGRFVQPGPGFYSTDFYTRKLIEYIDARRGDGKPFFAYAAYTSPHWPLQVPEPYLSKYKGRYDAGYDAIRLARIARMKQLGIIPADFTPYAGLPETLRQSPATANSGTPQARYVNAVNGAAQGHVDYGPGRVVKKWDSLTPLEKKAQARYMEIYAGMVDNLDHNIGLLIRYLKEIGEYDNTFIMFQSDNGAEGWPVDGGADPRATDEANAAPEAYAKLGTDQLKRIQYGLRWAEVSAAPFRNVKGASHEGSVSTPLIVRLPGGSGQGGRQPVLRDWTYVTDNTATFLAVAGIEPPRRPAPPDPDAAGGKDRNAGKVVYKGRNVYPVSGTSLLPLLRGDRLAERGLPAADESYGRGYVFSADGRWKAVWAEPPQGPTDGHWQLYDLRSDRGENRDVAAGHPEVVAQLVQRWQAYMTQVGGVEPLRPAGFY